MSTGMDIVTILSESEEHIRGALGRLYADGHINEHADLSIVVCELRNIREAASHLQSIHNKLIASAADAWNWLSQCHDGTQQKEIADDLRDALAAAQGWEA